MPSANALKFNYDTVSFEPNEPAADHLEFDYDRVEFRPIAAERGSKAMVADEEGNGHESESTTIIYFPDYIRRICESQQEAFAAADKSDCSYNLFAADERYHDRTALNRDTKDMKEIISQRRFWTDERADFQDYGINRQFGDAVSLSVSMRAEEREMGIGPTIRVLRGVPGSGKTFAARSAGFPGMILADGEPVGTLATDNSKTDLYHAGGTSDQIHSESSLMYRRVKRHWLDYVQTRGGDCSEIHDRVFDDPDDINEILENATETGRRIDVLDIDVPYVVSAVRVLLRPKDDPQPHPGSKYMEKTFRKARETRIASHDESILCSDDDPAHTGQLLKAVNEQGLDVSYRLMCYDYESDPKVIQREAAHLEHDEATGQSHLVITDERLYKHATDPELTEEEIAKVRDQVIDQEFVDWYCDTFFNDEPDSEKYIREVRTALAEYVERGLTIYQALNDKNA